MVVSGLRAKWCWIVVSAKSEQVSFKTLIGSVVETCFYYYQMYVDALCSNVFKAREHFMRVPKNFLAWSRWLHPDVFVRQQRR